MSNKKKRKPKTVYFDDGRSIADMSVLNGRGKEPDGIVKSGWREKWRTYFQSVKMMLLPMLVVLGLVCIAFGLLYLLLALAS